MQDEGKEKLNCYMVKSLNRRGARGGLSLRLPTGFIRPDPTGSECSIFSRPMIDINAERQRRQGIAEGWEHPNPTTRLQGERKLDQIKAN